MFLCTASLSLSLARSLSLALSRSLSLSLPALPLFFTARGGGILMRLLQRGWLRLSQKSRHGAVMAQREQLRQPEGEPWREVGHVGRWKLGPIERRCRVTVLVKPLTQEFFLGPDSGNSNILLLLLSCTNKRFV